MMPTPLTRHGVFMRILGVGVLFLGKSGIGKSELALGLLDRGHVLIADDCVELSCTNGKQIMGRCPELLKGFLEVRGLGILDVRKLYGGQASMEAAPLELIINMVTYRHCAMGQLERLAPVAAAEEILGVTVPVKNLPIKPERNVVLLAETLVRQHKLGRAGFDAAGQFCRRQFRELNVT